MLIVNISVNTTFEWQKDSETVVSLEIKIARAHGTFNDLYTY
jgi:hypothetical protein